MTEKRSDDYLAPDEILIDGPRRSLAKALTWRIIATSTTMAIVAVFTGKLLLATSVGIVESLSKMLFYYLHERAWNASRFGKIVDKAKSDHVSAHRSAVTAEEREQATGTSPVTLWFTGLPGSGKTTLSYALERRLFDAGLRAVVLDGENMRLGLCRDLGFEHEERSENVRRTAESAKILNRAGVITICGLISPYEEDRRRAEGIIGKDRFFEVFLDAPEEIRRKRASKYDLAERGEIKFFSGVSDPYDRPSKPDLYLNTAETDVDRCLDLLMELVMDRQERKEQKMEKA